MRTLKYIFLPILGVLAAVLAFRLAAPFQNSLIRNLPPDDPHALFTWGTKWGAVNRIAFGAIIGGTFSVVLALGRRSLPRILWAGALGTLVGGAVNFVTDSGSDLIGLSLAGYSANLGGLVAMLAWCVLVPAGVAFTVVIAQGYTKERMRRAVFATRVAFVASFFVQIAGSMLTQSPGEGQDLLLAQIPVWRMVEIAVGLALGLTMVVADEYVRAGSIRLILGRNEARDWSLDYEVNRIGSAEGCEIPLFGMTGVEPVHASIVRRGDNFMLEAQAQTLVNGQPATQVMLNDGDMITVGQAQLAFSLRPSMWQSQVFVRPQPSFQPAGAPIQQPYVPGQANYHHQPQMPMQPAVGPVIQPMAPLAPGQTAPRMLTDSGGHQLPLPIGRYTVGREPTNAICLRNDPSVARNHAEVIVTPAGLDVVPIAGIGITKINGVQITAQSELVQGDIIEFGSSRFTYCG